MPTRRYGEDEVREIFALATTGDSRDAPVATDESGLTLEQLHQIGREAGIAPARIDEAAARLETHGQPTIVRRTLGMPIGVSRIVALPRAPNDHEWDQLVALFRTTFGVRGQVSSTGGLRDWSQGNLHIAVEPTANGHQLRLSTRKEDALALNGIGFVTGGMSALMGAVVASAGKPEKALVIVGMFGSISVASFVANFLRLPAWARERESQMKVIGEHAVQLLGRDS
jgi:hypothetical protein